MCFIVYKLRRAWSRGAGPEGLDGLIQLGSRSHFCRIFWEILFLYYHKNSPNFITRRCLTPHLFTSKKNSWQKDVTKNSMFENFKIWIYQERKVLLKSAFKTFCKIQRITSVLQFLFNKSCRFWTYNLIQKRLWHNFVPVNFSKNQISYFIEDKWIDTSWKVSVFRNISCSVFSLIRTEYSVSLDIQSECGKIWTRKTLNADTFYAVWIIAKKRKKKSEMYHNPAGYRRKFFRKYLTFEKR